MKSGRAALLVLLALCVLVTPLAVEAQQAGKVWRIGYLGFESRMHPAYDLVRDGLRELGYIEGKNIILESRWASPDPGRFATLAAELAAATSLGMAVYSVKYARVEDHDRTLATLLKDRPSAIFFWGGQVMTARRESLCDFALKNRLPTLGGFRGWTEAGCLISYAPNISVSYRSAAMYVDKILKGVKPGDLPIAQPTKYELVINLKTAKALGLTIPPSLLLRADQVIE